MEELNKMRLLAQIARCQSQIAQWKVTIMERQYEIRRLETDIAKQNELIAQAEKELQGE